MIQLSLLDPPRARRTDPATSHAAADRTHKFAANHEAICFGVIADMGARGATAKDVAAYSRLDDVQANRRLSAMGARGLIARIQIGWKDGKRGPVPVFVERYGCAVWWRT